MLNEDRAQAFIDAGLGNTIVDGFREFSEAGAARGKLYPSDQALEAFRAVTTAFAGRLRDLGFCRLGLRIGAAHARYLERFEIGDEEGACSTVFSIDRNEMAERVDAFGLVGGVDDDRSAAACVLTERILDANSIALPKTHELEPS